MIILYCKIVKGLKKNKCKSELRNDIRNQNNFFTNYKHYTYIHVIGLVRRQFSIEAESGEIIISNFHSQLFTAMNIGLIISLSDVIIIHSYIIINHLRQHMCWSSINHNSIFTFQKHIGLTYVNILTH